MKNLMRAKLKESGRFIHVSATKDSYDWTDGTRTYKNEELVFTS